MLGIPQKYTHTHVYVCIYFLKTCISFYSTTVRPSKAFVRPVPRTRSQGWKRSLMHRLSVKQPHGDRSVAQGPEPPTPPPGVQLCDPHPSAPAAPGRAPRAGRVGTPLSCAVLRPRSERPVPLSPAALAPDPRGAGTAATPPGSDKAPAPVRSLPRWCEPGRPRGKRGTRSCRLDAACSGPGMPPAACAPTVTVPLSPSMSPLAEPTCRQTPVRRRAPR